MTAGSAVGLTAVVLSGGRGSRLGGVEKSELLWRGRPLLDHLLDSLPAELPVVVVGPEVATARDVRFTLEEPRFGGPVAGVAAALPLVRTPRLFLVATDMPLAGQLLPLLTAGFDAANPEESSVSGVVAVDESGKAQPLCAVYDTAALKYALAALDSPVGAPMRLLTQAMNLATCEPDPSLLASLRDVDTPEDLAALD